MNDRRRSDADQADMPSYLEMLREASGAVPDETINWHAFHSRLSARAELPMARLRHPSVASASEQSGPSHQVAFPITHSWWEYAARWSRLTVAASLAAGVALVAVVRMSPKEPLDAPATSIIATTAGDIDRTRAAFESAVVGRTATWTIDSALMPSATELLIPLGSRGTSR